LSGRYDTDISSWPDPHRRTSAIHRRPIGSSGPAGNNAPALRVERRRPSAAFWRGRY